MMLTRSERGCKIMKQKRGLANASAETRRRVASAGGRAHDRAFYSEIGRIGGSRRNKRKKAMMGE
jgi:general stress protein YciG